MLRKLLYVITENEVKKSPNCMQFGHQGNHIFSFPGTIVKWVVNCFFIFLFCNQKYILLIYVFKNKVLYFIGA